jgi:predicted amidohydrolase
MLKFALLQYPIVWADPQANLRLLDSRLAAITGQADIAVLPEMFSTGFCTDRMDLAEPWGGPTCCELQRMADAYDIAIMGSMIIRLEDGLRNRGFLFAPHAVPRFIDKRHLYKHGGEAALFKAGDQREVWEYKGARIRLAICYDLRFPVWLRQDPENMYDILVCVACWPKVRVQYWDAMLPARAAENQALVIGVNMVGTDGTGEVYNGHSAAYDTWLREVALFNDEEEGTRIVELSVEKVRHYRSASPLWQDADEYEVF